jgi:MFS family permease
VTASAIGAGVSFGTVYTFGAFFEAMADDLGSGRGSTALVFGITLLLFFGMGIVIAPLADRLGPRRLVAVGVVLLPLGLVLTSRVDTVAAGYVTYGIGVGLGGSLVIAPLFTAASGWIVRRRALALGVLATGNGLGTLCSFPRRRLISDQLARCLRLAALIDLVVIGAVASSYGGRSAPAPTSLDEAGSAGHVPPAVRDHADVLGRSTWRSASLSTSPPRRESTPAAPRCWSGSSVHPVSWDDSG